MHWGMQRPRGAAAHEWQHGGSSELDSPRQQDRGRPRGSNKPAATAEHEDGEGARARTHDTRSRKLK